jgi:glyoxylase-like metal-dependent hydrolase (beta-lactamase superfamily II)
LLSRLKERGYEIHVQKGVRDILNEHGVDTTAIEAVIWSHWHFDHTGNPATFEPATTLIVGPGFKSHMMPGYPAGPGSPILETDYAGRQLREMADKDFSLRIGRFRAFDYFGDGSFFLLDAPGHAIGHLCAFARVTSNPDSFIFMGGDSYHHGGEIRPSPYMPLPEFISPHPFLLPTAWASLPSPVCPGSLFEKLSPLPNGGEKRPFYEPAREGGVNFDVDEAIRTIKKLQEADVADNVFVASAHDVSLLGVVDFFPAKANDFMDRDWVRKCRWRFLRDFAVAVGRADEVQGRVD